MSAAQESGGPAADPEVGLIGALVEAIHGEGIGPKRGAEIAHAVRDCSESMIELMVADRDLGPEQIRRAIQYVTDRADAARQRQIDAEARRGTKTKDEGENDPPADPPAPTEPEHGDE